MRDYIAPQKIILLVLFSAAIGYFVCAFFTGKAELSHVWIRDGLLVARDLSQKIGNQISRSQESAYTINVRHTAVDRNDVAPGQQFVFAHPDREIFEAMLAEFLQFQYLWRTAAKPQGCIRNASNLPRTCSPVTFRVASRWLR